MGYVFQTSIDYSGLTRTFINENLNRDIEYLRTRLLGDRSVKSYNASVIATAKYLGMEKETSRQRCYEAAKTLIELVELSFLHKDVYPSKIDLSITDDPFSAIISTKAIRSTRESRSSEYCYKYELEFIYTESHKDDNPNGGYIITGRGGKVDDGVEENVGDVSLEDLFGVKSTAELNLPTKLDGVYVCTPAQQILRYTENFPAPTAFIKSMLHLIDRVTKG